MLALFLVLAAVGSLAELEQPGICSGLDLVGCLGLGSFQILVEVLRIRREHGTVLHHCLGLAC